MTIIRSPRPMFPLFELGTQDLFGTRKDNITQQRATLAVHIVREGNKIVSRFNHNFSQFVRDQRQFLTAKDAR